MKYLILALAFFAASSYAATCTTTTRTNYSTGQVLTSTALNADFNQLVNKVNGLDGGCITDGTLEASALNTTDFAAMNNGIKEGCGLVYVDSNTLGIDRCIATINGGQVKTTAQTNVTWGCSGCSAEASNTQYYIYGKTGSSGSTLSLLISTSAPNSDGYDSSGNKVLGRFLNDSSSNVLQNSIASFNGTTYERTDGVISANGATDPISMFSFRFGGTDASNICTTGTCFSSAVFGSNFLTSIAKDTIPATGEYIVTLSKPMRNITCMVMAQDGSNTFHMNYVGTGSSSAISSTFTVSTYDTTGAFRDTRGLVTCWAQ